AVPELDAHAERGVRRAADVHTVDVDVVAVAIRTPGHTRRAAERQTPLAAFPVVVGPPILVAVVDAGTLLPLVASPSLVAVMGVVGVVLVRARLLGLGLSSWDPAERRRQQPPGEGDERHVGSNRHLHESSSRMSAWCAVR